MGKSRGSTCKLCRREGVKLFLKGNRCITDKCAFARRNFVPGEHGSSRTRLSNYGIQLREKQKLKRIYGLLERQFKRYFRIAEKSKGVTGETLLQLLERRLDNVIFRMCLAFSRAQARQIVSHSWIDVNSRKVNIASYLVKAGDIITARNKDNIKNRLKDIVNIAKERGFPAWMEVDLEKLSAKIIRLPTKEDVQLPIQVQLIVELYSK